MSISGHGQSLDPTGSGAVAGAFANQVRFCRENEAPLTARIVAALAALLGDPGRANPFLERVRAWPGAPLADALPLRCAGGLHALHLAGLEPALGAIYRGEPVDDVAIVAAAVERHAAFLLPWLDGPPQTNEAGRSASFVAALLWLADQGLPSRFAGLEIGASAGINLMMDRFGFALGGVEVGPDRPALHLAPDWRGPPPPRGHVDLLSLRGCDVAPVDLADPAQALRLKAYVWPEHRVRFERIETAIALARRQPPDLVAMNAADFIEAELARPQQDGTTRVLLHSIVWQYLPADQQDRIHTAMEAAGTRASAGRALAWVALEANRTLAQHELLVRFWPGQEAAVVLGRSHPHGAWMEWFGEPRPAE